MSGQRRGREQCKGVISPHDRTLNTRRCDILTDAERAGTAVTSGCRRYLRKLTRRWSSGPDAAVVGLNPSTTDRSVSDPPALRCVELSPLSELGWLAVVNICQFVEPFPSQSRAEGLRRRPAPTSLASDAFIIDRTSWVDAGGPKIVFVLWTCRNSRSPVSCFR